MSRILCDYVNKTRFEPRRGVVIGFSRFQDTALRSMKEDLDLNMTVSELRFCQRAYNTPEQSAPTLDEIYFLDAISNGLHHSKDFASVARLQLYHQEAVRTYRDLLEKRTLLAGKPRTDAPSLCELSELLTRVLARSGKQSDLAHGVYAIADPLDSLLAAAAGLTPLETLSVDASLPSIHLFSGCADFRLNVTRAEEDDAILLLKSPIKESADTAEDSFVTSLALRVSLFAKSQIYQKNVHAYRAVDHRGVAVALASLYDGIYTEIASLPSVFDDGELYDLALCEHASLLVTVPRHTVERFSEEAEEYGILVSRIARAVKGNRFTVRKQGHALYSFRTSFLREFSELRIPFLLEGENEPQTVSGLIHSIARNADASGIAESERRPSATVSCSAGLCSAAGSRKPSFESGLNTALLAILEAILSGAELSRLFVTDLYVYPEKLTSASMGNLFEAFLGVYRVLAELAIPNTSSFLPFCEQGSAMEGMAVYCLDKSPKERTEHFTTHGAEVYLIALPKNDAGVYDFQSVRSLLHLLSELRKNQQILSVGLGVNQAPSEIIEKMCSVSTVQYDAFVSKSDLEKKLDGIFIILEASSEIKALKCIGSVQKNLSTETATAPSTDLPVVAIPLVSQKRIPVPTVVLLPSDDSGNLHALTELFQENGCVVRISPDLTKNTATLEGAQIAMLCGRSTDGILRMLFHIKEDLRATYALRTLIACDGILLAPDTVRESLSGLFEIGTSIGSMDAFRGAGVYLHDGLNNDAVQKLTNFYR